MTVTHRLLLFRLKAQVPGLIYPAVGNSVGRNPSAGSHPSADLDQRLSDIQDCNQDLERVLQHLSFYASPTTERFCADTAVSSQRTRRSTHVKFPSLVL